MADLTRYTQEVFGSGDANQDFSQFGGFVANVETLYSGSTITPALVQALANYTNGWFNAIIGNNAFTIQDRNSLDFLFSYQLAYLLQKGIAEWDSGTTYYTNSIIQYNGIIYQSTTNANTNNAPGVGSTHWAPPQSVGQLYQNQSSGSYAVSSGETLFWPYADIQSGDTITINSGGYFRSVGKVTVLGTMIISGTSVITN